MRVFIKATMPGGDEVEVGIEAVKHESGAFEYHLFIGESESCKRYYPDTPNKEKLASYFVTSEGCILNNLGKHFQSSETAKYIIGELRLQMVLL